MSVREAVLLLLIVGAIALTLRFQDVISDLHRTGDAAPEHGATLPRAGTGG